MFMTNCFRFGVLICCYLILSLNPLLAPLLGSGSATASRGSSSTTPVLILGRWTHNIMWLYLLGNFLQCLDKL